MTDKADESSAFTTDEAMKFIDDALYGESETKQAGDSLDAGSESDEAKQEGQEDGKPAAGEPEAQPAAGEQPELTAENAVIAARDGKHTIPFERLAEARQSASEWKQQAEQAQAQLQALLQQAEQRQATGQQATSQQQEQIAQAAMDAGYDPEIFGSFDTDDLANGINRLVDQKVAQKVEGIVQQHLAPLQQAERERLRQQHDDHIFAAHPDALDIAHSNEFAQWVGQHPGFQQVAIQQVLESGSAQDVVDLFAAYKSATAAPGSQQQSLSDAKAKADQAVSQAKQEAPASLSDIPGGRATAPSREEAMDAMDPLSLVDAMTDMNPEQLERYLNRM